MTNVECDNCENEPTSVIVSEDSEGVRSTHNVCDECFDSLTDLIERWFNGE